MDGKKIFHNPIFQAGFIAFFITMVMECLSKRSVIKMFIWLFTKPQFFIVNWCIVSIPFFIAVAFRRKYAIFCLVSFLWVLLGVIDCAVISSRVTPFTFNDVKVLKTVLPVIDHYIKIWQLVLIIIAVLIVLGFVIFGFFKLPKIEGELKWLSLYTQSIVAALICFGFISLSMKVGLIETRFANIRNAYNDYGLAYCFTNSVFNTGVKKPKDYSVAKVDDIIKTIATDGDAREKNHQDPTEAPTPGGDSIPKTDPSRVSDRPNVIFVQLESFFNVNRLENVVYKENPIPVMTSLYENCYTGLLSVPSISAGTANTEFEVLTGMNMDDFGPGEYPYKTVLSERTAESIAYNLKDYGYATHAIHNNTASFYSRNVVYPNLGIDNFTSIEFMTNVEYNQLNWARDEILTRYIAQALDSTSGQDFVFTVSVQGHGAYPDEDVLKDESLLVSIENVNGEVGEFNFAYYLEQLRDMDTFVGELIRYLETRPEKSVLVLYGDHLPGFDFYNEDLNKGSLYETEYAIWSNYDLGEPVRKDLQSYQLSAYVEELLGYETGLIARLHQGKDDYGDEEYLDALQTLEYDMLYGDMLCWNGVCPYKGSILSYGHSIVDINGIKAIKEPKKDEYYYLMINGSNYNEYSVVFLNNVKQDTIYVDDSTLFVAGLEMKKGDMLTVCQYGGGTPVVLSSSEAYFCKESDLIKKH